MDVQLYVYDLSKGLARNMSMQFLGIQIDAVYHTSIVLDGIEYYFGQGSYDLFTHNCNNFSNDFAMFLVGKGIPDHITSLPQTVLNTPFGQMLRPQIDAAMRPITQAPTPQPAHTVHSQPWSANGTTTGPSANGMGSELERNTGRVSNITTLKDVDRLLALAKDRCAIIFFTSSTCPPCKLVYQPYDDLAAEIGTKCVFIKIDFSHADHSIGTRYPHVRATPTFITYLKGEKQEEWSGADPRQLRSNVEMLVNAAFPPHPHLDKSTPTLLRQSQRPVKFTKVPPLEKLVAKMGDLGNDPAVASIVSFIQAPLLDEKHAALKASALSLAMNISSSGHQVRMKKYSANPSHSLSSECELPESEQVELLASLLETISTEEHWSDNMKMSVICVGWLVYAADMNGELHDLWKVTDAAGTVGKADAKTAEDRLLVKEVKSLLEA
ncbi:thioredoxin [Pyrenophora tritici-repentis Pt-1C-BFP]|uniref:Thioredoxin n=1 Tax=Pyrenophora tritici-repentis (strain Pt-1C-BFP) TaxID=426418 RepID=B2W810_PYRTR|nr:thioredoxin [Pyrenophora tritici-repentis Pt-1C-BFP]EDU48868.1 thioredoxin [Pyrenophora tritici-repentis Pt-1C-BFP]